MLAVTAYPREYVTECATQMDAQLAAYEKLAGGKSPARERFEPLFFANLVLVLDRYFVQRVRALEGREGNALNEVRMLCESLLNHGGVLTIDDSVKYSAARSILPLEVGTAIHLDERAFRKLSNAFFAEMRRKYTKTGVSAQPSPSCTWRTPRRCWRNPC